MSRRRVWVDHGLAGLLSLALASIPLAEARAAPAQSEAQAHFEAAAERYAREDYAGAASEFAIAYALEPSVDTLFAWAQAERLAGQLEQARRLYDRLLAGELSTKQREAITELRAEVDAELADMAEAQTPEPEDIPGERDEDREPEPPAKRDNLAIALSALGGTLFVAGAGLLIGAGSADAKVRNATDYQAFADAYDSNTGRGRGAVTLYSTGTVLAGLGVAALIVGVVRLTRRSRAGHQARITPAGLGLSIGLGGPL